MNIREQATADDSYVRVRCDFELLPTDVITKRLIFDGPLSSGATVDCNGALLNGANGTLNQGKDMIEVRSRRTAPPATPDPNDPLTTLATFEPVTDVTIRHCRVTGSVRVWGMGMNGEREDVRASSRLAGHTWRARAAAPAYITLDDVDITATGRTPVYFSPGVSYSRLLNSELTGVSDSVALYLDAESYGNEIRGNYLHVDSGTFTGSREQMAIDTSSANRIINNRFSRLNNGGIYLFRNCGEGGTVRHATPSYNHIINNVFYYTSSYTGDAAAISLGSRNGGGPGFDTDNPFRFWCGDDAGVPWGSSVDDRDFATQNVVMQNQIYVRSVADTIVTRWPNPNSPNYIAHNTSVTTEVSRSAGCYISNGYPATFITHGSRMNVFRDYYTGEPTCTGYAYVCDDGNLGFEWDSTCRVERYPFGCGISGSNAGCSSTFVCPNGGRLIGAQAACNLEWGGVTDAQFSSVPTDILRVVTPSANVNDGVCWLGPNAIRTGDRNTVGTLSTSSMSFGCSEHDANGGDCDIRAVAYCSYFNFLFPFPIYP